MWLLPSWLHTLLTSADGKGAVVLGRGLEGRAITTVGRETSVSVIAAIASVFISCCVSRHVCVIYCLALHSSWVRESRVVSSVQDSE